MRDFAAEIGADGITLWQACGDCLVALANPLEPAIVGRRQPLDRGLISRVYHTGQAILEQTLKESPLHDPGIDQQLGTRGVAMMAAPVETIAGGEGGVISAVILENNSKAADFSLASLGRLTALAQAVVSQWEAP